MSDSRISFEEEQAIYYTSVFNTAVLIYQKGYYYEALKQYGRLLDSAADHVFQIPSFTIPKHRVQYNAILCLRKLEAASSHLLERAIDINRLTKSSYKNYLLMLGHLYLINGKEELGVLTLKYSYNKEDYDDCLPYSYTADELLLSVKPTSFLGFTTIASVLINRNDYSKALLYLNEAININPNNPFVWESRANVNKALNNIAEAESDYLTYKTLDRDLTLHAKGYYD
jgi:tetratricopeptide (TPR) repeat protein